MSNKLTGDVAGRRHLRNPGKRINLKINIKEILKFFDEAPESSNRHASAIVGIMGEDLGIALIQKYFLEKKGIKTQVLRNANQSPIIPSLKTQKGHRLDRWLLEIGHKNNKPTLFQVEIKNWSAHAIGGESLLIKADPISLKNHRRRSWLRKWDEKSKRFKSENMEKVLIKMVVPDEQKGKVKIAPLICFWDAVHPKGKAEPLFEYKNYSYAKKTFSSFWVFSLSNYLRTIRKKVIDLEMPDTVSRINWLHILVKSK